VTPGPTAPRIAIVAIVLSFALAVAVGILRTVNAEPVERAAEVAGNVAFVVVFAAPALLALLGLMADHRSWWPPVPSTWGSRS
jgi:hypothetical protein